VSSPALNLPPDRLGVLAKLGGDLFDRAQTVLLSSSTSSSFGTSASGDRRGPEQPRCNRATANQKHLFKTSW
jgi:hypothetical protein